MFGLVFDDGPIVSVSSLKAAFLHLKCSVLRVGEQILVITGFDGAQTFPVT